MIIQHLSSNLIKNLNAWFLTGCKVKMRSSSFIPLFHQYPLAILDLIIIKGSTKFFASTVSKQILNQQLNCRYYYGMIQRDFGFPLEFVDRNRVYQ